MRITDNIEIIDGKMIICRAKIFGGKENSEIEIIKIKSIGVRTVIFNPSVILTGHSITQNNIVLFMEDGRKMTFDNLTDDKFASLVREITIINPNISIKQLPFYFGGSSMGFPVSSKLGKALVFITLIVVFFIILLTIYNSISI